MIERGKNYDYRYTKGKSRWVRNCIEIKLRVGKLRDFIGLVLAIHLLRGDPLLDPVEKAAKRKDRCNFDRSCFEESLKVFFQNADTLGNVVDEAIPRTNIWHISSKVNSTDVSFVRITHVFYDLRRIYGISSLFSIFTSISHRWTKRTWNFTKLANMTTQWNRFLISP